VGRRAGVVAAVGRRVVVDDGDTATAGVAARGVTATEADQAAARGRSATVATAGVDVVEDGSAVVLDHGAAAGGGGAVVVDVAVAVRDVRSGSGEHVTVIDVVAVAQHRAVTADDVAVVVTVDDHAAVGGGVRGLVAERDVPEAQVEGTLLGVGAGVLVRAQ